MDWNTPPPATDPGFIRTADNVRLFYGDWGDGALLVFLSGWTLNSDMWAYQMVPLSKQGYRCFGYDRRTHGRSSDPGAGHDFDTLADDLITVLRTLDLNGPTLIAHSFARGDVVRYITRHGAGRIARLVFIAPASTPFLLKTADNATESMDRCSNNSASLF